MEKEDAEDVADQKDEEKGKELSKAQKKRLKKKDKKETKPKANAMALAAKQRLELLQKEEEKRRKEEEEERIRQEEEDKKRKEEEAKQKIIDDELKRLEIERKKKEKEERKKQEEEERQKQLRERLFMDQSIKKIEETKGDSERPKKKKQKKKEKEKEKEKQEQIKEEKKEVKETPTPVIQPTTNNLEDWEQVTVEKVNFIEEDKVVIAPKITKEKKKETVEEVKQYISELEEQTQSTGRCPIICVLGHVDTGKTKLLDSLRHTNVQAGEVGGITQQIGATFIPPDILQSHINKLKIDGFNLSVPGLLIIDTPGHESFSNLRNRGSNLCDFAILVVDLMHGIQNQTIESLNLLKKKNIPFVIALNKIDRLYGWKELKNGCSKESLLRNVAVKEQFYRLYSNTITQLAQQEINAALYWDNKNPDEFVSVIPTSAITGEGISDLIGQIVMNSQAEKMQTKFHSNTGFSANVMEVKVEEGLGATIDVILVNGDLNVDDIIVVTGLTGPIITKVKSMMTPKPMKEMRVKGDYIMHKSMKGSIGIKLMGEGLGKALAGSEVFKASSEEDAKQIAEGLQGELAKLLTRYISISGEGILVQSSTLGSLEAILEHLQKDRIPVCGVGIGELYKNDIAKLTKVIDMKDDLLEYKVILAFEIKISQEAEKIAKENDITIIPAKIIYHLFDKYKEYCDKVSKMKYEKMKSQIVFPCVLEIIPDAIFHTKKPLIFGVRVKSGVLKKGTPLCVTDKDNTKIGCVEKMEINHKEVESVRAKDGDVAIRLAGEDHITYERHFNAKSVICSIISRESIDALKKCCRDMLTSDDIALIVKLKAHFGIA